MLLERPLEMRLVGKPRFQRHVGDQLAIAQLILGKLDTPVDQEGVGRHAVMLLERADQVGGRQLRRFADIFELEHLRAVLADEVGGAFELEIGLVQRLFGRVQA